jgi:hypothetical protein
MSQFVLRSLSGVKTPSCGRFGTTEVVPCYKAGLGKTLQELNYELRIMNFEVKQ